MGQETAFKSITGGIFEFGFSDAIFRCGPPFSMNGPWQPLAVRRLRDARRNGTEPSPVHRGFGIPGEWNRG